MKSRVNSRACRTRYRSYWEALFWYVLATLNWYKWVRMAFSACKRITSFDYERENDCCGKSRAVHELRSHLDRRESFDQEHSRRLESPIIGMIYSFLFSILQLTF